MGNIKFAFGLTLVVLALAGCVDFQQQIEIEEVHWIYENRDFSTTTDLSGNDDCYANFTITYSGDALLIQDIASVTASVPGSDFNWNIVYDITGGFNPETSLIGSPEQRYSNRDNRSTMPIGPILFRVKLRNDYTAEKLIEIPAPGKIVWSNEAGVYTSLTSPGANYVPMLAKADVDTTTKESGSTTTNISRITDTLIKCRFTVTDANAFNGWFWFYDSEGSYLGKSKDFYNQATGVKSAYVVLKDVSGAVTYDSLPNSGEIIQIELDPSSAVIYEATPDFEPSDIASYRIVICDGLQYVNLGGGYGYYSVSEKVVRTE